MEIVDFHTHAFPDAVAEKAIPFLEEKGGISAYLDGKVSSLLKSMDKAGIEKSVICSIATKPEQFTPILNWSKSIASERLIPFLSVHPDDPGAAEKVRVVKEEGFKGIKLHPYYQEFNIDEERMFPIYEKIEEYGLILVSHTGFDFAFRRVKKCDPERIVRVLEKFPGLKLVTTHLGGWEDWEEVKKHLVGKPVYMEISFSIGFMGKERAREILTTHPKEYLLFGTDSPWSSQEEYLASLLSLEIGEERESLLLSGNAKRLLGLQK
ncbi:MAG: amidohydrolase family protein [Caldiserica bacterium]|nr:amidohydrolase family protein [Caldisericota bacterium]